MIEILLQAERALEMGRIDVAETLYRQVADNDPRNAIAVVGLARVTLEQGDEVGALTLARRALSIDPENAAAGRMVTRLEEVRAYRGERVPSPEGEASSGDTPPSVEVAPVEAAPVEASPVAAEPAPGPIEVAPPPADEPPPRRRRSWLDRLLRRGR